MNNLDLLRPVAVFAAVVEAGSFRAAADRFSLSPPYVSQMISELEARLGVVLLYRTTRRLTLTPEGEGFISSARQMAAAFEDGLAALQGERAVLVGRLRVNAPTLFAVPPFARVVAAFAEAHPRIALELTLDDAIADPVAEGLDLVLRIGDPGADPRPARRLFDTYGMLVAGPSHPPKAHPVELPGDALWLKSPARGPSVELIHGTSGEALSIEPARTIQVNSAAMIRAMLAEGTGLALLPDFAVREALLAGTLTRLCPDWATRPVGVFALYTARQTHHSKARAFVDHLLAAIPERPPTGLAP